MDVVLVIATLGLLAYFVVCLFKALFVKGRRLAALKRAGITFVAFFVTLIVASYVVSSKQQKEAHQKGYDSYAEMQAAEKAAKEAADNAAREAEQKLAAEAKAKAEADAKAKVEAEAKAKAAQERAEKEAVAKAKAEQEAKDAACRKELSCWGEKAVVTAGFMCGPLIERMAKYDYEWTDSWIELKFSHYRWRDKENGIVTIIGDKIKFQNGFGAWTRMVYECDIDPESDVISDVRVQAGRI